MKISRINLLDILGKEEFADLAATLNRRKFDRGEIIYHPYEEENLVMIVARGRVRVYLSCEEKEFTLAILSAGDIYASHTRAFVSAMEDTELLVTGMDTVSRRLTDIPEFTGAMVHVLGNMLSNSFSIIEALAFKDTAGRLSGLLVSEARQTGAPEGKGIRFHLNLTVEEVAKVVGASRQTVSSLLNGWIREGLIEKRGRGDYFIPDPDRLEKEGEAR